MLKIKDAPEIGAAEAPVSEQAELGALKSFGKQLASRIRGEEKTVNITVLLNQQTLDQLKKVKGYAASNKPDIIVVEEEENADFKPMLEGGKKGKSVEEYLAGRANIPPAYGNAFYNFLREMKKDKVKVEQLSPRGSTTSLEMQKKFERFYHMADERITRGDFEGSLDILMKIAEKEANADEIYLESRAAEVAQKITEGKWKGSILIETHISQFRDKLVENLKGMKNVRIKSFYAKDDDAAKVFGKTAVFVPEPMGELERMYRYGKKLDAERNKLLAARELIISLTCEIPLSLDAVKGHYKETKLANQLSFEECRVFFKELGRMDRKEAFKFLQDYVKKRESGQDVSSFIRKEEKPAKELLGGAGKVTKVTLMYEYHSLSCLKEFMEYVEKNKPAVIAIEWPESEKFKSMLDGKISIEEFLMNEPTYFYQRTKELFEFLKKHKDDTLIEAMAPGWMYHSWLSDEEVSRKLNASITTGNFENAVDAMISNSKATAEWANECERLRVNDIAKRVDSGEWHGEVVVMSGAFHRLTKYALVEKLNGTDIKVSSNYAFSGTPERIFGDAIADVGSPGHELSMLYEGGKDVDKEREKLLGAREAILLMISRFGVDRSFGEEAKAMSAVKLVNQLSFKECKALFGEIKDMTTEVRNDFVDAYVKKRDGKAVEKESAGEFTFGGNPIGKLHSRWGTKWGRYVQTHVGGYEIRVKDTKEVATEWFKRERILKKVGFTVWYSDEGFDARNIENNFAICVSKLEKGIPYLKIPPLDFQAVLEADIPLSRKDLVLDRLVNFEELKNIVAQAKAGKLSLSENSLRYAGDAIKYEDRVMRAASLAEEAKKLREHPKVEEMFEKKVDKFVERMKKEKSA